MWNQNYKNLRQAISNSTRKRRTKITFWKSSTLQWKSTEQKQSLPQVPKSHKDEINVMTNWFERKWLWKRISIYLRRWNFRPLNDLIISLNLFLSECNSFKTIKIYFERRCLRKFLTFGVFWKELTKESTG